MQSVVPVVSWRALLPGQVSQLCVVDTDTGGVEVLFEDSVRVIEAPNWSADGETIIVNSGGLLYRFDVASGELVPIETAGIDDNNNDHLLSPDGLSVYTSSEGTGHIFAVPTAGGVARRISNDRDGIFSYFIQGISADGTTLGYAGAYPSPNTPFRTELFTIPTTGGPDSQHSNWDSATIGVEFSPDGQWWYFNSEVESTAIGHSQVFRMRPDASHRERLTNDERVNWFPKLSPDGERIAYLSFEPGTIGHGANVPVQIRLMDPDGRDQRTIVKLFGGQGTLNVNGWAPDSRRLAFMAYPVGVSPSS